MSAPGSLCAASARARVGVVATAAREETAEDRARVDQVCVCVCVFVCVVIERKTCFSVCTRAHTRTRTYARTQRVRWGRE